MRARRCLLVLGLALVGCTVGEREAARQSQPVSVAVSAAGSAMAVSTENPLTATSANCSLKLAPVSELRNAALASGMRPLVEDGKIKILNGVTTPLEIAKMTQVDLDK